jgi:hypothetical protein
MKSQTFLSPVSLVACVLLPLLFTLVGCRAKPHGIATRPAPAPVAPITCPLDGLTCSSDKIQRRPLGVMIENSPEARPQHGLAQACVVYEGLTEGGIPRFLAIYLHQDPPVIGPVRSARPHFIYLAQGYDAAYVHCGESIEALELFNTNPTIRNLDEMRNGKAFWRDHSRRMPHNLFTSSERLRKVMQSKGWDGASTLGTFSPAPPLTSGIAAKDVTIRFGGALGYKLRLLYDAKAGGYRRFMDGVEHKDPDTGKPLIMKNVVVQMVDMAPFAESKKETMDVTVLGGGAGYVFSAGFERVISWKKDAPASPITYTDYESKPLPWQPGALWVELVPNQGSKITMK